MSCISVPLGLITAQINFTDTPVPASICHPLSSWSDNDHLRHHSGERQCLQPAVDRCCFHGKSYNATLGMIWYYSYLASICWLDYGCIFLYDQEFFFLPKLIWTCLFLLQWMNWEFGKYMMVTVVLDE